MSRNLDAKVAVGLGPALQELGISPRQVLTAASLPSRLFEVGASRLPLDRYLGLWWAIGEVSEIPDVGIQLVRQVRADHTEPLFLALFGARDLAGALRSLVRYKRALGPEHVIVDTEDEVVTAGYSWPVTRDQVPQVLVDVELAFLVEMARRATGDEQLTPTLVTVATPALDRNAGHADYFGCKVVVDALRDSIAFTAEVAHRPFRTHNPELLIALDPYLSAGVPQHPVPTIDLVTSVVSEQIRGGRPTVRSVSEDLAMSPRSLQRLLHGHGTSFRALLDDVRNQHAQHYLTATRFTDAEIAFLLGYEEPTSFARAFRYWNGLTPRQFRSVGS